MTLRPRDTLRHERACGSSYSFLICNGVSLLTCPTRPESALTRVERTRLKFPSPRRANSDSRRSALRARGKVRKPGAKFALAGLRLLVGPGRSVDSPVVFRSISWSSSSEGVKRGGVLWECGAFYESNVVGSSLLYDSLPLI